MSQVCSLSQADPRPRASHSVRAASIDCLHVDTRATNYANTDSTFRPMALRHQTFLIRSSVSITGPYRFTDTTAVWRYPIARPIPDALGSYPATRMIDSQRILRSWEQRASGRRRRYMITTYGERHSLLAAR